MSAFFHASCPSCHRRYGWSGTFSDKPLKCPHCGYEGNKANLASDMEQIRQARELFREYRTSTPGPTRRNQRIAAGLTIGQAARQLDITIGILAAVEDGSLVCTDDLAAQMNKVYGVTIPK